MREIKFRAWDKGAKQLYNVSDMTFNKKGCCVVRTNNGEMFTGLKNAENYELLQYTGLHDKNGVEVFEGDIVQTIIMKAIVRLGEFTPVVLKEWCESKGVTECVEMVGFYCEGIDSKIDSEVKGTQFFLPSHTPCGFAIIGNIYDNPELLKESE